MSNVVCYHCNKELTEEEVQHWEPFGLCDKCKGETEIERLLRETTKDAIHTYWKQPPHEQRRLRLLVLKGRVSLS